MSIAVVAIDILTQGRQLLEQGRQPFPYRLPRQIEVNVEIVVGHAISHFAHATG